MHFIFTVSNNVVLSARLHEKNSYIAFVNIEVCAFIDYELHFFAIQNCWGFVRQALHQVVRPIVHKLVPPLFLCQHKLLLFNLVKLV